MTMWDLSELYPSVDSWNAQYDQIKAAAQALVRLKDTLGTNAVAMLRALDRPITYEGGSAVLRPCVGIATLPEHGFDPAELLMAADVARHIAATREEGYHLMQAEDRIAESQVVPVCAATVGGVHADAAGER